MTRAEAIAQAIVAALIDPPMTSLTPDRVVRDPVDPTQPGALPVLNVELGAETAPEKITFDLVSREVEIDLIAIASGQDATTTADDIIAEAHRRLLTKDLLDGLAMSLAEGDTQRRRDDLDRRIYAIAKRYRITYQTPRESL